jgi:shikimate dehydrogenase
VVRVEPGALLTGAPVRRAAVLGSPVAHSLSPVLHQAAYAALGLDGWTYGRFEVDEGGLAPFVERLDESWRGLSLTMPLKVAAFDVADEVSEVAREAGAINTLIRRGSGWAAENTDVHGIVAALRDAGVEAPASATIIGSGATARSALLALREMGAGRVRVAARNAGAVEDLAALSPVEHVALADWATGETPVVVSTVPGPGAAAATEALGAADLTGVTLLDVVYADWPTPLARAAGASGARVVSGLEMLVHQAARQHELFTGTTAPLAAMQAAGRAALGR